MQIPDWLQSTLKWPVLLVLAFSSLFLLFDASSLTQMGAPCSNINDGSYELLHKCRPNSYDGSLFALVVVFGLGSALGRMVVALKLNLPPLLGMLIAGLLLKNLPFIKDVVGDNVNETMSAHIRDVALALILSRAGLGLDLAVLQRMKWVILRLAFLPCTAEALTICLASTQLLGFNWKWGMMLGWLWSAISPAVVVPSLLSLLERGYGVSTGIVPAAIAASALDDVASIVFFSIFLDFSVSGKPIEPLELLQVPIQLLAGIVVGVVLAVVVYAATRPKSDGETPANDTVRMAALVGSAVTALLGLKKADYTGCAALSVLVLALGAGKGWGPAASKRVAAPLTQIWNSLAQPLLFGLVGCQVDTSKLEAKTVGLGILMLVFSLIARFGTAFLSMGGRGLNAKEKLFTALSQLPKATVQAALCAIPTKKVQDASSIPADEDWQTWALQVLQLSVVIILCTAPVGATIIYHTGPKLLSKDGDTQVDALNQSLVPEVDEPDPDVIMRVLTLSFQAQPGERHGSYDVGASPLLPLGCLGGSPASAPLPQLLPLGSPEIMTTDQELHPVGSWRSAPPVGSYS